MLVWERSDNPVKEQNNSLRQTLCRALAEFRAVLASHPREGVSNSLTSR
jgi:hypothetical protein